MNEAFSTQTLAERLGKLNNSQQSIESLSSWCVLHRKKAKQIVETWDQVFSSCSKEQGVSLLYLANDILQNSKRKGSEFVNEFWKVLPGCLKSLYETGGEQGKKVVNRLVGIWDERKVFGSRGQGLKDEVLSTTSNPALNNGNDSNPVKSVRKDADSVRIKLAVGGMPEKIVSAYQMVLDEHFNEDAALNKCKAATEILDKMEKDIKDAYAHGCHQDSPLINNLQEQEAVLKQGIEQLENAKLMRSSLVAQLKEALKEQELEKELIDNQLQIAWADFEKASRMRQKLGSAATINRLDSCSVPSDTRFAAEMAGAELNTNLLQQGQALTSFASTDTNAEEEHRKAAAAVAAKLAASSSSAQVLSSIFSSWVAEEAASRNSGLTGAVSGSSVFPLEKRPRLGPISAPDEGASSSYYGQIQQQQQTSIQHLPPQSSTPSMQPLSQNNQGSTLFTPPLPPMRPPLLQPYVQSNGVTMGPIPFGYPGNSPQPPQGPGNVSHPPMQQQLQTSMGMYPSSGFGFFGQLQTSPSGRQ